MKPSPSSFPSQQGGGGLFIHVLRACEHPRTEQRERDAAKSPIVPALMLVREFPGSNPGPFEASGELIERRRDPLEGGSDATLGGDRIKSEKKKELEVWSKSHGI